MLRSAFPILRTSDLARALAFYRDQLGGTVGYQFPPDGEPRYVGIDLGESHLGIGHDPAAPVSTGEQRFSLWVYVDACDEVVGRLRDAGVEIVEEPADQPWGERIARVLDPDGNTVIIGSSDG